MKSSQLTDAVTKIESRSAHRLSSVLVCQGRWLEPLGTDLHVSTVSKKSDLNDPGILCRNEGYHYGNEFQILSVSGLLYQDI